MADSRGDLVLRLIFAQRYISWGVVTRTSHKVQGQGTRKCGKVSTFSSARYSVTKTHLCVTMKKCDTMQTSVRSNSLCKMVDLSRHRHSVLFPSDDRLLFTWFSVTRFRLHRRTSCTFFWGRFLFAIWGEFSPLGIHALFYASQVHSSAPLFHHQ